MADDVSRDCRVRIIEVQLWVRYVKLSDEKYRNIQQSLPVTTACYLSNQTCCYGDTFPSARNIKFELGQCSCGTIAKQSVYDYGG